MANTFRQYLQAETIILQVDLIVCFRNLQKRTDDAVSLFGDKEAGGICVLKGYKEYYYGYDGKAVYVDLIDELQSKYPLTEPQIIGESAQKAFIGLFGAILRMRNLLSSFDDFAGNEILSEREMQDYQGRYNDLYDEWRNRRKEHEKEDITDDIVFEVELIKQIEINIDYILLLVEKYHDGHKSDKELLITINKAVDSSLELRSKKSLIQNFIAGINDVDDVLLEWKEFVVKKKEEELAAIIAEEQKQLKQFTFYDLYWDLMRQSGDASAGRLVRNICLYMFTSETVTEPQDDRENFFWSNIVDLLEEDKQIEMSGKKSKNLNSKMRHFTFVDTYYKAIKLMTEAESGQYVKAICEYMFNGTERKLKSPVDAYFALAKRKLELSRKRKTIGSIGGKQERIKVTDEQVETATKTECGVSFEEFMSMHPNVQNDLYASRQHLLKGIDWAWLDIGMDRQPRWKRCNSLYQLLTHYKEIVKDV